MAGFGAHLRFLGQETSISWEAEAMRVLAAAVVVLGVLGGVAAADDGLVASGPGEVAEVAGDPEEWGTTTDHYYAVLAHELQLIAGTEGLTNSLTMEPYL